MDHDAASAAMAGLKSATENYKRPENLGDLEISITPRAKTSKTDVAKWAEMGVSRLILLQPGQDRDSLLSFVKSTADELF